MIIKGFRKAPPLGKLLIGGVFVCVVCGLLSTAQAPSVAENFARQEYGIQNARFSASIDEWTKEVDSIRYSITSLTPGLWSPLDLLGGTWIAFCVDVQIDSSRGTSQYRTFLTRRLGAWYGRIISLSRDENCPFG